MSHTLQQPETKSSGPWSRSQEETLLPSLTTSKPLVGRPGRKDPNFHHSLDDAESKTVSTNSLPEPNGPSEAFRDSRLPKHVLFYRNGDRYYKGKKMRVTAQRYRSLDVLLGDLTKSVSLPYGVRRLYTPNGGTRVLEMDEITDGGSYVCASFEKFKKLKYGATNEQDWSSARKSDPDVSYLYNQSLGNPYPSGGKYARAYGKSKGKTEPLPFSDRPEANAIPTDQKSLPPKYLSSLNNRPKLIKIVKAGKKPYQSVSLLLNRRSILSYEQLMHDISEAFGLPNHRNYKIGRLYNAKGDEIKGVADFFRGQDGVVIGATIKNHVTGEELVEILEQVLPDSSLSKRLRIKQMRDTGVKGDSGIENDDDLSSQENASHLPNKFQRGRRKKGDKTGKPKRSKVEDAGGDDEDKSLEKRNDIGGISGSRDKEQHKAKNRIVNAKSKAPAEPLDKDIKTKRLKDKKGMGISESGDVTDVDHVDTTVQIDEETQEHDQEIQGQTAKVERGVDEEEGGKQKSRVDRGQSGNEMTVVDEQETLANNNEKVIVTQEEEAERLAKVLSAKARREAEKELLESLEVDRPVEAVNEESMVNERRESGISEHQQIVEDISQRIVSGEETNGLDDEVQRVSTELSQETEAEDVTKETDVELSQESRNVKVVSGRDAESANMVSALEDGVEGEDSRDLPPDAEEINNSEDCANKKLTEKDGKDSSDEMATGRSDGTMSPHKDFEFSGKSGQFVIQPRDIYREKDVLEMYRLGEKVGDGNFADVFEGTKRQTGEEFAIKRVEKSKLGGKESMIENEIAILKKIDHPNIVKLYEEHETMDYIYLVMEYVRGGDLFDAIIDSVKFTEADASMMVRDLARALEYLHKMNVVHRDMKPENLLVNRREDDSMQLKLADFGLAMEVVKPVYTVCGTPTYVAPEILAETGYGLPIDLWALGVIMYILLCGFPPFRSQNKNQEELFKLIQSGKYEYITPYWNSISEDAKDLIDHLLVVDQEERYTAEQVLQHDWIAGSEQNNSVTNLQREVSMNLEKNFSRPSSAKR